MATTKHLGQSIILPFLPFQRIYNSFYQGNYSLKIEKIDLLFHSLLTVQRQVYRRRYQNAACAMFAYNVICLSPYRQVLPAHGKRVYQTRKTKDLLETHRAGD